MPAPPNRPGDAMALRRLVVLQIVLLSLLACAAAGAATWLLLSPPRVEAQPAQPAPVVSQARAVPQAGGEVLVIEPRPGETVLRLPDVTSVGAHKTWIPRPPVPDLPAQSQEEIRLRVQQVFPWRYDSGSTGVCQVFADGERIYVVDRSQVTALNAQGDRLWTAQLDDTDIKQVSSVGDVAVVRAYRSVSGIRNGTVTWRVQPGEEVVGITPGSGSSVYITLNQANTGWKDKPEADGQRLIDSPGELIAIDTASGRELWRADVNGVPESAAVLGRHGELYLACKSHYNLRPPWLHAYSSKGRLLWSYSGRDPAESFSSLCVGPDGALYAVKRDSDQRARDLLRLDPRGRLDWRLRAGMAEQGTEGVFAPLFAGRRVYICGSLPTDEHPYPQRDSIAAINARTGRIEWTYLLNWHLETPLALVGDRIYAVAGHMLHAIDSKGRAVWQLDQLTVQPRQFLLKDDVLYSIGSAIAGYTLDGHEVDEARLYLPQTKLDYRSLLVGDTVVYGCAGGALAVRP